MVSVTANAITEESVERDSARVTELGRSKRFVSLRGKTLILLFVDALLLVASVFSVILIRKGGSPAAASLEHHFFLCLYILPVWVVVYFVEGLYSLKSYDSSSLQISLLRGTAIAIMGSAVVTYFLPEEFVRVTPKTNLILSGFVYLAVMYLWRRSFFAYFSKADRQRRTFLIGSDTTLDLVESEIASKPHLGYRVVACHPFGEADNVDIPRDVDLIAIERHMSKYARAYQAVFSLLGKVEVVDLAALAEKVSGKIPISAVDESWFIEYCGHQESRSRDIFKAILDRSVAAILCVAAIPLALVLLPLLLVSQGRPLFFSQRRVGLNNQPFTLYKLRTMVIDAEKGGARWATPNDPRVTPMGAFLRKTRLDELPQLINILRGDMSLVGPRPERPEIIADKLCPNIPFYALRHLVKPGVTGWAQVAYRYGFSEKDSLEKLQYDLFYVKNRSFWFDILIILKTIRTVVSGAGQ